MINIWNIIAKINIETVDTVQFDFESLTTHFNLGRHYIDQETMENNGFKVVALGSKMQDGIETMISGILYFNGRPAAHVFNKSKEDSSFVWITNYTKKEILHKIIDMIYEPENPNIISIGTEYVVYDRQNIVKGSFVISHKSLEGIESIFNKELTSENIDDFPEFGRFIISLNFSK